VPISATSTSAVRRPTPGADTGDGRHERDGLLLNGQARGELGVHPRDGRIQVLQMRELLA
jgi:hypothetical protein